jgi:hypothetical protein
MVDLKCAAAGVWNVWERAGEATKVSSKALGDSPNNVSNVIYGISVVA